MAYRWEKDGLAIETCDYVFHDCPHCGQWLRILLNTEITQTGEHSFRAVWNPAGLSTTSASFAQPDWPAPLGPEALAQLGALTKTRVTVTETPREGVRTPKEELDAAGYHCVESEWEMAHAAGTLAAWINPPYPLSPLTATEEAPDQGEPMQENDEADVPQQEVEPTNPGRKRKMLKTALQAAVLVAATGTAVTTVPAIRGIWEPSDLERLQNKLEEVQAEVQLLDLQKNLRVRTAEVEARREACEAIVEAARERFPDAVAFFEANSASVFETAELVKTLGD